MEVTSDALPRTSNRAVEELVLFGWLQCVRLKLGGCICVEFRAEIFSIKVLTSQPTLAV